MDTWPISAERADERRGRRSRLLALCLTTAMLVGGVSCSKTSDSDGSTSTTRPDDTATTTTAAPKDDSKPLLAGPVEEAKRYKGALSSNGFEISFVAPAGADAVVFPEAFAVNSSTMGESRGLSVWGAEDATRPAPDDPPGTASVPVSDGYLDWLVSLPQVEVISDQKEDVGGVNTRAVIVGYKAGSPEPDTTCGAAVHLAEAPSLTECLAPGERAFATFIEGRALVLVTYEADVPGAEATAKKLVDSLKITIGP